MFAIVRAVEDLGGADPERERLLVLDEPTPFLPKVGVDQLFGLIRRVVAEGASAIFVSHSIDEVMEITDRATVLRDGALVGVLETRRSTPQDFVERIVGRAVQPFHVHALASAAPAPVARVDGLVAPGLGPVSFEVGKGEVLGLAGLIGSGFDRVCAVAYGAQSAQAGCLVMDQMDAFDLATLDPHSAIAAGIVFLPADRLGAAGIGALPVADNVLLPVLEDMNGRFGLDRRRMARTALELGRAFDVRPNAPTLPLSALSGGNQQKALLGEMASDEAEADSARRADAGGRRWRAATAVRRS